MNATTRETATLPKPAAESEAALMTGVEEHSLEKIEAAILDLGPHVDTLATSIEATHTPGVLQVYASAQAGGRRTGVFEFSRGVEAAILMSVPDAVITIAIEQTLRIADRACDWKTMVAICEWLASHPERGVVSNEARGPGHYRTVRTWRLERVHPEVVREWREHAQAFMEDAKKSVAQAAEVKQ